MGIVLNLQKGPHIVLTIRTVYFYCFYYSSVGLSGFFRRLWFAYAVVSRIVGAVSIEPFIVRVLRRIFIEYSNTGLVKRCITFRNDQRHNTTYNSLPSCFNACHGQEVKGQAMVTTTLWPRLFARNWQVLQHLARYTVVTTGDPYIFIDFESKGQRSKLLLGFRWSASVIISIECSLVLSRDIDTVILSVCPSVTLPYCIETA